MLTLNSKANVYFLSLCLILKLAEKIFEHLCKKYAKAW